MAYEDETQHESLIQSDAHNRNSIFGWKKRRRVVIRRRKLPLVRLGGKKHRRGFFMVRLLRRIKLRWLKLQYSCMLKRVKECYYSVVKELTEAGATFQSVQQRILMDASFTVPVMGASISIIPSYVNSQIGSNRVRSKY